MLKDGWKGRFYEDFEVGDVYRHSIGRTITESDNTWFTLLTMNTNQSHFNKQHAERSPFGKPLVNSGLSLAMVLGMSVMDVSQTAFANLGWEQIKLVHPVFVGDTLWAESLVLEKRESKSRPYGGIVTARTRGLNQDGTTVMYYKRSVMVYTRAGAEEHNIDAFPEPDFPIEEQT
ncbi:MAG: MaoC family dehydratase [Actinomycetota bacterium]|nr:MaoC family dehydratase [Actinomycetota bacterium]|tara:strand:- start:167 stop:691 length:525 start_codon:yes stop_codon:yes gene_type:complete